MLGGKDRKLKRRALASFRMLRHDVPMFEPFERGWLGLGRDLRPLRPRSGKNNQKKDRGAKLSHRNCRSKLESADRFESDPKLDSISEPQQ